MKNAYKDGLRPGWVKKFINKLRKEIKQKNNMNETCGERHNHLLNCKTCQALAIHFFAQKAGSTITEAKSKAARVNGKKGGRPRKTKV